jgi:hypothetical protein
MHQMNVSIYNLQRCLLPKSLWHFAGRSLPDFKNIYIDECGECTQKRIGWHSPAERTRLRATSMRLLNSLRMLA